MKMTRHALRFARGRHNAPMTDSIALGGFGGASALFVFG